MEVEDEVRSAARSRFMRCPFGNPGPWALIGAHKLKFQPLVRPDPSFKISYERVHGFGCRMYRL